MLGRTNEEKFERIFQTLTGAYMNDTLVPGLPCGCAVGNIIAVAIGTKAIKMGDGFIVWEKHSPHWANIFSTIQKNTTVHKERSKFDTVVQENDTHTQFKRIYMDPSLRKCAMYELESTGLSLEALMGIEFHFEVNASKGRDHDEQMYLGLAAVVDYLSTYFGLSDQVKCSASSSLKELFS